MSFGGMGVGMGGGGASGVNRMATTRGRMQGNAMTGVNYPHPFFDVAHTYLPVTVKQLFRWCRYYFLTNPLINATVFKLSEYPITDIKVEHESASVRRRWEEYFQDHLNYRPFQIECGLDYHTYGNGMVSMGFPFYKYLKCTACSFSERADKIRPHWSFTNLTFRLTCPKCKTTSEAEAYDFYYKDASGIRPIRWNCEHVEITYNDVTGKSVYFYNIPPTVRNDIVIGKKDIVESVPQVFIQALRQQKGVVFSKDNFFHLKRPTLAQQDRGWGIPLILPVLKDTFYLQLMKKAQEAILLEHIVPLRILFPQAGSGSADPYCVSPETLIETQDGLRPASEVKAGDYLRSHTGAWRKTEAKKTRQVGVEEQVFKVTVASLSGMPFEVSEDHPILAVPNTAGKRRERQKWVDPDFIPAKELKVGDYVAYPASRKVMPGQLIDLKDHLHERAHTERYTYLKLSQSCAEIFEWIEENQPGDFQHGERRDLLDAKGWHESDWLNAAACNGEAVRVSRYMPVSNHLAELVGYYLAEGSTKGTMVSLAFHRDETRLHGSVECCVRSLGFDKGVSVHPRPNDLGADVDINSVLLSELLVSLCGKGFASKKIPQELSEAEDNVVLRMISAIFSGDGCDFKTDTNRVALKLANPGIILEVRRLLLSFGVIGCIAAEPPTDTSIHKSTAYHLNYNGPAAEAMRMILAGGIVGPVAQKSGVFRDGYVLMPIREMEEVRHVTEVIGFQMAGDKSFCVAGVATHNTSINLTDWRDHVAMEIARWRHDNNYIPILPLPIGNQTLGGDGRALMLTQEIQTWSEQLMSGLTVPKEFLLGGMSYAGTNVSMRMLENQFLGFIMRHKRMANWTMKQVAHYMDWPEAKISFKPFKMADDIQRKAYLFQLNQAQKVSDSTLLADSDLDQEREDETMIRETAKRFESTKVQQLAMAQIQGEVMLVTAKYQARSQQVSMSAQTQPPAEGEPGVPPGGGAMAGMSSPLNMGQSQGLAPGAGGQAMAGVDIQQMAQQLAQQIMQLPDDQKKMAISNLQTQSPELAQMVEQMIQQFSQLLVQPPAGMGGQAAPSAAQQAATQVNMKPMPEQRGPRRAAATV